MDHFFSQAFDDLGTCRTVGMAVGPIPWDKILEYGRTAGLYDDILNAFVFIIRRMDEAYLELLHADKNKPDPRQTAENS